MMLVVGVVALVPLEMIPAMVKVPVPLVVMVRLVPAVVPRLTAPDPRLRSLAGVVPADVPNAKSPFQTWAGFLEIVMAAPLVLSRVPPLMVSAPAAPNAAALSR